MLQKCYHQTGGTMSEKLLFYISHVKQNAKFTIAFVLFTAQRPVEAELQGPRIEGPFAWRIKICDSQCLRANTLSRRRKWQVAVCR